MDTFFKFVENMHIFDPLLCILAVQAFSIIKSQQVTDFLASDTLQLKVPNNAASNYQTIVNFNVFTSTLNLFPPSIMNHFHLESNFE